MKGNGILLFLMTITGVSSLVHAKDVTVFEVKQPVRMDDDEPIYKDYYLNGGIESGLKRGMVITVFRRQSVYDSYQNKSHGNLKIPIGKLKVIQSQKGLAVAREFSLFDRKNLPVVDYDDFIVGDLVESGTGYFPSRNSSVKKPSAKASKLKPSEGRVLSEVPEQSKEPPNPSLETGGPI